MFPIGDDDSALRTVPLVTYALLACARAGTARGSKFVVILRKGESI
jgi:hypothetical protein